MDAHRKIASRSLACGKEKTRNNLKRIVIIGLLMGWVPLTQAACPANIDFRLTQIQAKIQNGSYAEAEDEIKYLLEVENCQTPQLYFERGKAQRALARQMHGEKAIDGYLDAMENFKTAKESIGAENPALRSFYALEYVATVTALGRAFNQRSSVGGYELTNYAEAFDTGYKEAKIASQYYREQNGGNPNYDLPDELANQLVFLSNLREDLPYTSERVYREMEEVEIGGAGPAVRSIDLKAEFDFREAQPIQRTRMRLTELAVALAGDEYRSGRFRITGFGDERGSDSVNDKLGTDRADSVRSILAGSQRNLGGRIDIRSEGKKSPIIPNAKTEEQHAVNRRVTIEFISN